MVQSQESLKNRSHEKKIILENLHQVTVLLKSPPTTKTPRKFLEKSPFHIPKKPLKTETTPKLSQSSLKKPGSFLPTLTSQCDQVYCRPPCGLSGSGHFGFSTSLQRVFGGEINGGKKTGVEKGPKKKPHF